MSAAPAQVAQLVVVDYTELLPHVNARLEERDPRDLGRGTRICLTQPQEFLRRHANRITSRGRALARSLMP